MTELYVAGKGDKYHASQDCHGLRAGQTTADTHDWDRTHVRTLKSCDKCATSQPNVIETADQAARLILTAIEAVSEAGFDVYIDEGRIKVIRGHSGDPELAEVWEDVPTEWHVGPKG